MSPELKELIESGEVSEVEVVGFIKTIKKLSEYNILDKRNLGMVIDHFGMKKKKGWLKLEPGSKVRL